MHKIAYRPHLEYDIRFCCRCCYRERFTIAASVPLALPAIVFLASFKQSKTFVVNYVYMLSFNPFKIFTTGHIALHIDCTLPLLHLTRNCQ